MSTRALGGTGLEVTRIGCGGWQLGGGEIPGPRDPADDAVRVQTVHAALEAGINWVDTAAVYGLGHSEMIVARALREGAPRPLLFSKAGFEWDVAGRITQSLRPDSLRRGLDASLRRLGVDTLDLYQLHWPVPDEEIEGGWRAMLSFKEEGLVRHVGVSNCSVEQIQRCEAIGPVESCQLPYSLAAPDAHFELLPYCEERGIGVIVYSPQAAGLLTGTMTRETITAFAPDDDRSEDPAFQEPMLTRSLELYDRLRVAGETAGLPPGALAIAWTLANPAVTAAIVGFDAPTHVADAVRAVAELQVFHDALRKARLLDGDSGRMAGQRIQSTNLSLGTGAR
jgi:aryl-alcohol dehydrogenase-like predicted oxidoreductase